MEIFAWIFAIILVAALVGTTILFYKNDNPQFALLALSLAVVITFQAFSPLSGLFWLVFLIAWLGALFISCGPSGRNGTYAALAAVVVIALGLVFSPSWSLPQPSAGGYELYLEAENGETPKVDYHANESTPGASSSNPLVGSATVNDTFATMTLPGNGPVKSWGELVERFNAAPDAKKAEYVSSFNESADLYGGTWDQVIPKILAAEKAGVDTRVIRVVNSDISDEEARNKVRENVGGATDSLPLVRVNGAVLTTNGGVGSDTVVNDWADARSMVRVSLTSPQNIQTVQPAQASANVQAASASVGVDTECTNQIKGGIEKPKPQPKTPVTPKTTPSGSTTATPPPTTPSTTPPTTTPPTTTPPTTTPPTTTPPTTPPPTTTPPTTPPPTTTPPTTPPPTTTPPTTPPPTTTPPTTPPPTTPTPECTYLPPGNGEAPDSPKCLEAKDPEVNLPAPTGKPTVAAPTGAPETTAPVETAPAQPTTQPSSTATQVAPGATTPTDPIVVPSSDPVIAPTAGTEIGDPDATTSVVNSQAKLSAEQEVANQQAAQAIADQAAANAAAQAAAEAEAQAAAANAAAQAAAEAEARVAAQKAAEDAAAKAAADKAAAEAAAAESARAIAAQKAADEKATEIANNDAKDKAAEVAKSVATAPAEVAEPSPMGSSAVGLVGLTSLLFGASRKKKALMTGRKH